MEKKKLLAAMGDAVLKGERGTAEDLARQALGDGMPPIEAVDGGFVPGLKEAGRLWDEGEYFLPELVASADAMKAAMAVLKPALSAAGAGGHAGKVVIGTVEGDIHDIGKTLVATMLTANGFEVIDCGADVKVPRFVDEARAMDADIVCASALLTTTMTKQRDLVGAVRSAGLRAKVCIGGAPVTKEWADSIGADGWADNAVTAVAIATALVGKK